MDSAPPKRAHDRNPLDSNGRGKRQKNAPASNSQKNQPNMSSGTVVFRVLCPSSKSGSIIGKGGGIVSKIRQETGAKIRIEEPVPGCDERVVVITGSEKESEVSKEQNINKEDADETVASVDGDEDSKKSVEEGDKKGDTSAMEGSKPEKPMSSAQKALMLIYERIVGEPDDNGGDEESKNSDMFSFKLLIPSSQAGRLIGKGGNNIKRLSSYSGADIVVGDKPPLCASPNEEVVQISGGVDLVRKGIQSVCQQLIENPPRERDSFAASNPSWPPSHPFLPPFSRPEVPPPGNFLPHPHGPPFPQGPPFPRRPFDSPDSHLNVPPPFLKFHEGTAPSQVQVHPESITFRLLCPSDKVGSVIGKGGKIVKTIQHETCSEVKVETDPELEDRIIVISGPALDNFQIMTSISSCVSLPVMRNTGKVAGAGVGEHLPGDMISPAQDAVLRVQERIYLAVPDDKGRPTLTKLLVSSNQIGCLLGKGGSIITEMRKVSGAHIRILGKDQVPKGFGGNDEVVQVTGDFQTVQEALVQITTRLRNHLFRDKVPHMNHTLHPLVDQVPPFVPYMGGREPSSPRIYSNLSPFQNDSVGRPIAERMPPAPWAPQGMREGLGPTPQPDFPGLQRRSGAFSGGSQAAVITNTTVEVAVPRALVPSIYGEDGFCLRRIREISEAKITITEPRPEATETVIIISGTPEQTHAAQSLLQAFVMSETGAP